MGKYKGKNTFKKKKKKMKGIAREKKKKRERCLILELICKITGKDKGLVYIACICSLLQFWCRQKYLMGEIGHFSGTHR